jgi:hypothetical protein
MVPLDVSNLEVSNDEPDKVTQFSIEYIQRLYESVCEKEQTEDLPPVDMDALIQSDQQESKSEQALQIIGHVVAKSYAHKRSKHGRRQFMVSNAT